MNIEPMICNGRLPYPWGGEDTRGGGSVEQMP